MTRLPCACTLLSLILVLALFGTGIDGFVSSLSHHASLLNSGQLLRPQKPKLWLLSPKLLFTTSRLRLVPQDSAAEDGPVDSSAAAASAVASSGRRTGEPDPSALLSGQSATVQKVGVVAILATLAAGTVASIQFLTFLETILPTGWDAAWRDYTWAVPMGLIFCAAGTAGCLVVVGKEAKYRKNYSRMIICLLVSKRERIADLPVYLTRVPFLFLSLSPSPCKKLEGVTHFTMKDTFTAMVPPLGTWGGLWQVPAPFADRMKLSYADYHTYWSGVCEFGGGLLLILAQLFHILPVPIPAFLLFLLTAAVTPANMYMATHNIQVPGLPAIPYPVGHVARGILQCVILSFFWKLTFQ
jgi:uncharacterized membrane protein